MKRFSAIICSAVMLYCALPAAAQDALFDMTLVAAGGDTHKALLEQETLWEISSSSDAFSLPDAINQKALKKHSAGGKTVIRVLTGNYSVPCAITAQEKKNCLAATRIVHPSNPVVAAAARKIALSPDPVSAAEKFVNDYITVKTLGIPFANDEQVLSLRRGDCTEHAVLLVSVLRAAGIPSRAAAGIVLIPEYGGRKNTFGFHMWVEAYTGGRWVLADATFSGSGRMNRYITLARHNLKTESPIDYTAAVIAVQNLAVRRVER